MQSSNICTLCFHREEFRKSGTQKSRHKNTRSRWLLRSVAHPLNIFPAENSTVKQYSDNNLQKKEEDRELCATSLNFYAINKYAK